jgi:hypothetical protein
MTLPVSIYFESLPLKAGAVPSSLSQHHSEPRKQRRPSKKRMGMSGREVRGCMEQRVFRIGPISAYSVAGCVHVEDDSSP